MTSSLNRIFKVIWSKVQMAWVAVSEATTAHGKQQSITRITRTITTVAMLSGGAAIAAPPAPNQLPTGGQVAAGVAAIGTNGNTMTVTQSSNRAAINWNTFDIGSQAQVNFVQPSANAVALNRVNSGNPSQIFGQLSSNGQIYLINAAGVYFAPGAQVNVGGIVATTMQMSDAAFMAGSTTFERNGSTGKVINEGTITTSLNGYIAMLAPEVRNSGLLLAQSGTVAMGAGERITLNFGPTSKLDSITVTAADIDTLVENRYAIKAPNGLVILSARAANQLAASVVNSGTIEAKGVSQQGGRILLEGSTVSNTGTLDVSSDTAQAGTIQINGKNVSISGNVVATTPANAQGGSIKISATQSLNVANANLNAGANNGTGGQIELSAHQLQISDSNLNADGDLQGGTVQISATASQPNNPFHDPLNIPTLPASLAATGFTSISSRGRRGQGGNATLTGDNITLDGNTAINVSGATGGGNALIGGDWQGTNGTYQATTVYMGQNVTIDASATDNGNGGKVVLWSDVSNTHSGTQVYGTILATGGAQSGNGGKIETSGHWLDITGVRGNASASNGQGGTWLLDPGNVTIANGAGTNTNCTFTSGSCTATGDSTIYGNNIQNLLNAGTSVSISTGTGGRYNIVVYANIDKTAGGDATLTLEASGSIIGNNYRITSTGSRLNVVLSSNVDGSGDGIDVSEISTGGGGLWVGGGYTSGPNSTTWVPYTGASPISVGDWNAGGGGSNQNAITLWKPISTSGGNIYMAGATSNSTTSASDIVAGSNGVTINAGAGNITFKQQQLNFYPVGAASGFSISTTGTLTFAPLFDYFFNNNNSSAPATVNLSTQSGGSLYGLQILGSGSLVVGSATSTTNSNITVSEAINTVGSITLYGGNITVNNNLTTTGSTSGITLKASGFIQQAGNTNVTTSGGDVTYWADSDGTGSGAIGVGASGTVANITTGSGNITLGGGASDPLTGYASAQSAFTVSGDQVGVGGTVNLTSTSGNITLNGQTNTSGSGIFVMGNINAGTGKVAIKGLVGASVNTASTYQAVRMQAAIYSNSTASDAISIIGNATSPGAGTIDGVRVNNNLTANGTGGGIYVNGSGLGYGINTYQANFLARSGPILLEASNPGTGYDVIFLPGSGSYSAFGQRAGSGVTSSSANVIIRADNPMLFSAYPITVDTTGTFTLEPSGTSFTNNFETPNNYSTLVLNNISGLTFGKTGNTANIAVNTTYSIAGPINYYGGNITLNADQTTTNTTTGNVYLEGNVSGSAQVILANSRSVTFNQTGTSTYSGQVSGTSVSLNKQGAGVLILGRPGGQYNIANAYITGGTLLTSYNMSSAAVNISSGATFYVDGTSGVTVGSIAGYGNITFNTNSLLSTGNDNTSTTFGGVISGSSGSLQKIGTGTLTLTGANTYGGQTDVANGTLQIGNGTANGALAAASNITIASGKMLTFNRSDSVTVANNISGAGNVTVAQGTVNITGRATYTGLTTVNNGSIVLTNNTRPSTSGFSGNGTVTIQPVANFTAAFDSSSYTFANTLTGLTIGRSGMVSNVTIGSNLDIAGSINLYGGNISLNANVAANAAGSWLSLYATGNVTQGAGKVLSNDVRFIGGGGNLTLDSAANLLKTLAASGVANMTVNNSLIASALALNAIDATGNIKILNAGSLVLNGNVSTTSVANSTSVPALLVAAGYDQAAGTGGFSVLNNGGCCAVNVGIGGLGLIYTGTVGFGNLNSIPGLASGSGNFRYNTTYSASGPTAGFTAPLTVNASASNLYVLYRQQPTLTVTANTTTSAYGSAVPTPGFTSTSQNGDTIDQIFGVGNGPTVTLVGNTSTAGFVVAGNATLVTAGPSTNLLGYATPSYVNGTAVVTKANITVSGTTAVANKEYDGNTNATFTNVGTPSGILVNSTSNVSDVVNLDATGNFSSKNVADAILISSPYSLSGADAANYEVVQPTVSANITPKTVVLSAAQTYSGSNTLTNVTIVTGIAGETLTYTGATANSSHVADNSTNYITAITLGDQAGATSSSGGLASNYQLPTLNHSSAPVTIAAAPITLTASGNISRAYDGTANASVGSGNYTVSGLVTGDSLTLANLSTALYNNAHVAGASNVTASNLTLASISGNHSSATSDYDLQTTSLVWGTGGQAGTNANITAAQLTVTGTTVANKEYDATTTATLSGGVLSGAVSGDTLSLTQAGNFTSPNAANVAISVTANDSFSITSSNHSSVAGDYVLIQPTGLSANITQRFVTLTDTQVYSGSTTLNNVTIGNLVGSQTLTYTGAVANSSHVADNATNFITALTLVNGANGGLASNYQLPTLDHSNAPVTIIAAPLTLTATGGVSKVYSGNASATVGSGNYSVSGLVAGDTGLTLANLTSAAFNNANVLSANSVSVSNLTLSGLTGTNNSAATDYDLQTTSLTWGAGGPGGTSASITVAPLGIEAAGIYSGSTTVAPTSYTLTGLQGSDTITGIVSLTVNNANVAATANGTQYIVGIGGTTGTADLSNYQLNSSRNATTGTNTTNVFTMARANLTVTPNNNAIFIGEALPSNSIANVSYSGLVGGQTAAGLITAGTLTAGSISNSAGTVGNTSVPAGSYNLTASGWSADNYAISYANGTFTVSPSDALIVQVGSQSMTYGTSLTTTAGLYGTPTVRYKANGSAAVTLSQNVSQSSGNYYVYDDGLGGTVAFNITAVANDSDYSTSQNLKAGIGYQLTSANVTPTGGNLVLTNGTTTTGALSVNAMAVNATASSGVSKVYDGTTSMNGLSVSLSPAPVTDDQVSAAGSGAFSQANVGTNLSYTLSNLALTGADAGNYVLTGGTSASGSNGEITPRTVTLSANQTYSGSTLLTGVTIGNLVGSETLTYTGNASSKNVSDNATNYIFNLTLGNGANGGLSSNYQLPTLNHTNAPVTITRLNSVTWTGGTTGNWFDPANWAGGAVPDLNNVANVVIPNGITVTFNTSSIVPPAQLGTVSIDSLGGAGGNLTQTSGTLDVGSGGITLGTLTLQGGNLSSQGSVMLTTYNQSNGTSAFSADLLTTNYLQGGGNTTVNGNLNAQTYNQSGGSSTVLGALTTVNYLQSNGTTAVTGNLTSGNMTLTGGDTVALSNLVVTNTLDQQAGNLSITGSTTAGNLSLSGGNLTANGSLTTGNLSQSNGTLTANSSVTVNGTYSLSGGNASIAGNLQAQTYNQSGGSATALGTFNSTNYLQSNGTTTVTGNLTSGNMTLTGGDTVALSNLVVTNTLDQQAGNLSITGNTTAGNLSLSGGNLTANGSLTTGNLSQSNGTLTANSSVIVNGTYSLSGGNASIAGNLQTQTYNQSGGSATVLGTFNSTIYIQSNGTTTVTGNLTATNVTLTGGNTTTLGSLNVNGSYNQTGGQVNVTGSANITTTGTMTLGNLTVGGTLHANSTAGSINQSAGSRMAITGRASFYAPAGTIALNPNNYFPGGDDIIDRNGDRNRPQGVNDWVFQQIMVQGGTMVYIPLPKNEVGQSKGTHKALAFTGEVVLLDDETPDNVTDPRYMSQPEAGFTDRFFGTAPRITLLPEADGRKLVQQGDRLFIVNTDTLGVPKGSREEDNPNVPKPRLHLSAPDEAPPVKPEKVSRVFP